MLPLLPPYTPREPVIEGLWVIVPLSRPHMLPLVRQNYARQRYRNKRLCIVENGSALGACAAARYVPDLLLTSDRHPSIARNTALAEIRRRGGGFVACWDDDDYYYPEYLNELAGHARTADLLGKSWHFVLLEEELLLCHRERVMLPATTLMGPTLAGFAEVIGEFPIDDAEDVGLCRRLYREGAKLFNLSAYHFCYRRSYPGAQQSWSISSTNFRALQASLHALTLGPLDEAVITGERPVTRAQRLLT